MVNISEILKNAPKGLNLFSPIYGEVKFHHISLDGEEIHVTKTNGVTDYFHKDGRFYNDSDDAECMLFPSKEHKTWDKWQNVLYPKSIGSVICGKNQLPFILGKDRRFYSDGSGATYYEIIKIYGEKCLEGTHYASVEERKNFFDRLSEKGNKWDGEKVVKNEDKPKFNIGDWIIKKKSFDKFSNGSNITQIKYIEENNGEKRYWYSHNTWEETYVTEYECRLWNIQDSKIGDILVCDDNIFIFHEIDELSVKFIFAYDKNLKVCYYNVYDSGFEIDDCRPATKEEYDLFFSKMKEYNVEWDNKSKELIETKSDGINDDMFKNENVYFPHRVENETLYNKKYDFAEFEGDLYKAVISLLEIAKERSESSFELEKCVNILKSIKKEKK